jgi:hypothetical protein
MKTKVFFLLCLFFGIGLTQLSAQPDNKNGIGATVGNWEWESFGIPVYCDGVLADVLVGTVFVKEVIIWKNGVWIKANHRYSGGDIKSLFYPEANEVFKVMVSDHCVNEEGMGTLKVNFIGDKGSHYIGNFIYTFPNGSLELVNMICN